MSTTYEPLAIEPPDLERIISAHLREALPAGTYCGRLFPGATQALPGLPFVIAGTTYTAAVVIRDDGGRWPSRTLSATVVGARDADYATIRSLAVEVAGQLSMLATVPALPIAAVTTVRGPLSVADNPPEFQVTTDLVLVG